MVAMANGKAEESGSLLIEPVAPSLALSYLSVGVPNADR
jgi:hypothetical protein